MICKEIEVYWLDDQAAYGPDQDVEIDMLYDELEFVIHNVAFLHNELRDEVILVVDEVQTTDV